MTPTNLHDLPTATTVIPTITIYGPSECPNCEKAMRLLDRREVPYTKIDIDTGDDNHRYITEVLGYQQAPVITVDLPSHPRVHWGGHRMDMLTALVRLCTIGLTPTEDRSTTEDETP